MEFMLLSKEVSLLLCLWIWKFLTEKQRLLKFNFSPPSDDNILDLTHTRHDRHQLESRHWPILICFVLGLWIMGTVDVNYVMEQIKCMPQSSHFDTQRYRINDQTQFNDLQYQPPTKSSQVFWISIHIGHSINIK